MIVFDPAALRAPLAELAADLRDASAAPAVVVEVTRGAVTARLAAGVANLATETPAGADQTFDAGSQAKMMTAVVVLQLAEEGLIDLDAPAARWLPLDLVAGVPNADLATVRQLLAMTSGVPNYTDAVDETGISVFARALLENPGVAFGSEEALEIARGMAATGAPGEAYAYSNTNYLLLGSLIEAVTGEALADVLEARVFAPVGMTATSARPFEVDDPRLSSYAADPGTGAPIDVTDAPWILRGEGGVVTTTADITAFLQALLVERTLLSEASFAAMTDFAPIESEPGAESFFGLGLARITIEGGADLVGFTGGTLGTESSTYLDLTTGAIVSVAATSPDANSLLAALTLAGVAATVPAYLEGNGAGAVRVVSGSAADLSIAAEEGAVELRLDGATLRVPGGLADLRNREIAFDDGSALLIGGGDDDVLTFAGAADNRALGRGGDDRLRGASGDDALLGGAGEDVLGGRCGDDRLYGGSGEDRLFGGSGDDRLVGGGGADRLVGGGGCDVLVGGEGADTFVFASDGSHERDVLRDFEPGLDRIDLSRIAGLDWVGGAAFSGETGELRYAGGVLAGDLDGDGAADFEVALSGRPELLGGDLVF